MKYVPNAFVIYTLAILVSAIPAAAAPAGPYGSAAAFDEAIESYQAIADAGGWPALPAGPSLALGTTDPRVETLRERLAVTGELTVDRFWGTHTGGPTFDAELDAAVRAFQRRHGLADDGVVGPATREALNVPVERRLAQLERNRERLGSFLDQKVADTPRYVLVNLPDFHLSLVEDGRSTLTMKTVIGQRSWATPPMSSAIDHLEVNPDWVVPPGIYSRELGPRIARDPGYLRRNNMVRTSSGKIRQLPGPGNALGQVKFHFPSRYHIYLHDTPTRSAFEQDRRTLSHGCVRVERATDLALALLAPDGWDAARLERVYANRKTQHVKLSAPVPVHLVYWTAWVAPDGSVQFREDVYGEDA